MVLWVADNGNTPADFSDDIAFRHGLYDVGASQLAMPTLVARARGIGWWTVAASPRPRSACA